MLSTFRLTRIPPSTQIGVPFLQRFILFPMDISSCSYFALPLYGGPLISDTMQSIILHIHIFHHINSQALCSHLFTLIRHYATSIRDTMQSHYDTMKLFTRLSISFPFLSPHFLLPRLVAPFLSLLSSLSIFYYFFSMGFIPCYAGHRFACVGDWPPSHLINFINLVIMTFNFCLISSQ